ncbi:MAG: hypothetical protein V5A68_07430 [Candidatus Thermoplasmatota archaeon]
MIHLPRLIKKWGLAAFFDNRNLAGDGVLQVLLLVLLVFFVFSSVRLIKTAAIVDI